MHIVEEVIISNQQNRRCWYIDSLRISWTSPQQHIS